MSKHTSGPWEYDGKFTVGIPHKDGDTFFRTNPEDARLIAAAPMMYEMLKGALDTDYYGKCFIKTEALQAMLAEAEGRE